MTSYYAKEIIELKLNSHGNGVGKMREVVLWPTSTSKMWLAGRVNFSHPLELRPEAWLMGMYRLWGRSQGDV